MKTARILIVEDEAPIRDGLIDAFTFHGYEVDSAVDGDSGLSMAKSGRYDLLVLDVMLPGMDGFELCNAIRQTDRRQPIIMLTAKSRDEDIINGLSLGADDYVTKPFSIAQLILRVRAVLRRSAVPYEADEPFELAGDVHIDVQNLSGSRDGEAVQFTRREMDILRYLGAHTSRPVSRNELLQEVWGYARSDAIETRTVDIHIAKLRRKIEIEPSEPKSLITIRGAGYRLLVES